MAVVSIGEEGFSNDHHFTYQWPPMSVFQQVSELQTCGQFLLLASKYHLWKAGMPHHYLEGNSHKTFVRNEDFEIGMETVVFKPLKIRMEDPHNQISHNVFYFLAVTDWTSEIWSVDSGNWQK